jgi:hypothetical protein
MLSALARKADIAKAGMNTSGAGGLYPSEACGLIVLSGAPGLDDDLGLAQKMTASPTLARRRRS